MPKKIPNHVKYRDEYQKNPNNHESSESQSADEKNQILKVFQDPNDKILWSRIIDYDEPDIDLEICFNIHQDSQSLLQILQSKRHSIAEKGSIIFDPQQYFKEKGEQNLLSRCMQLDQLDNFKKKIANYTNVLNERVTSISLINEQHKDDSNIKSEKLSLSIHRKRKIKEGTKPSDKEIYSNPFQVRKNKSSYLKLKDLNLEQKIDIVHQVIVGLQSIQDVSKTYLISYRTITGLLKKIRKNIQYF